MTDNISVADALREVHKQRGIPSVLPESPVKTYIDLFEHARTHFSSNVAYESLGVTLTFADVDRLSDQFAAYLQSLSFLQTGDRVAVQLPNVLQYPVVSMGILKAGMVVVNVNPLYTSHELEHQINDSGAKLIIGLVNCAKELEEIAEKTTLEHVILTEVGDLFPLLKRVAVNFVLKYIRGEVPSLNFKNADTLPAVLRAHRGQKPGAIVVSPEDIAVLQYTGGTTGVAKGVMLTHDNLIKCMHQVAWIYEKADWREGEMRMVTPLPLYHIYAFSISFTHALNNGHSNLLIADPRDIKTFVKALKKKRFNGLIGLNTLFNHLMDDPNFKDIDFSHTKLVLSGGMALSKNIADRWQSMTSTEVCEGYGLTECSGILSVNCPGYVELGTVGLSFPSTEIKIVSEDGNALPCGESGELRFRGPSQMKGYWGREDATNKLLDEEGYMATGDIAVMHPHGMISIVDRLKDMIIVSGFNVYPNEIEDVVIGHPEVSECAAVAGKTDEGEYVRLFVVSRTPELSEKALRDYCREYLTAYKVPRKVVFVDDMPKSNVGKILRRKLRELYPEETGAVD